MISGVPLPWEQCREHYFDVDGSLRDLYVLNTTRREWQAFIDYLQTLPVPVTHKIDGELHPLPADAGEILTLLPETLLLLSIDLHGMIINGYFYEQEIELDLDPREVTSETQFAILLDFMRDIARAVGQPIRLTDENNSHFPLIEVFPDSSVCWWHPDGNAQR